VRNRRSLGMSKLQKFAGTAIVSVVFGLIVAHYSQQTGSGTTLSFVRDTGLKLGILYYVWAFLVLTSSSHAVNLTDGLDGLAAGSSILVFSAYIFIAFWQFRHTCDLLGAVEGCYGVDGPNLQDAAIVASAGMGAVTGFLWWNAAPARIFMGDTGALAIGGLFGALALVSNTALLLVILGGLFVIETASVIIQVISFRGFHRRVFRMSPIHHHFELAGWPEFTVIVRFWIIAGLCVAVGLGLFYADFIARGGLG
jgi:phospho-N-acetylmuramoyl-pentapeptide-transferase